MYTKWGNDFFFSMNTYRLLLDYCLIVLLYLSQARYSTNVHDIFVQAGKRTLKLKGVHLYKIQIAHGLQYFKRAIANDPTLLEELQDYEDYETIEEDDDIDEEEDTAEQMLSFGAVQQLTDLENDQNKSDFLY